MADLTIAIRAQNQAQAALNSVKGGVQQIEQAAQSASQKLRNMGESMTNLGGKLSVGVTAPILGFAGAAIKAAADSEQLEVSFTTMLGSAEKAKNMMAELSQFAASTPFETPEIQNASKMLLAFGVSAEDIIPTMTNLGDIAAGLNIPLGDLAYLFGTTRASGRLMTADLNQFTSRGIPMIAALAKTMGVAESEVKGLVEAGKVGFPEVQAALTSLTAEGGQFSGLMEAQSQTLSGLFSTFSDNIGLTLTAIGQQIIETFDLKTLLAGALVWMERMKNAILNFAKTQPQLFKLGLAFAALAAAIGPALIALGALMTALAGAAPVFAAVGVAIGLVLSPLGLLIIGIGALVALDIGGIRTKFEGFLATIKLYVEAVKDVGFGTIASQVAISKFPKMLQPVMRAFERTIVAMGNLKGVVPELIAQFTGIGDEAHDTTDNIRDFVFALTGSKKAVEAVDTAIRTAAKAFKTVKDAVVDFVTTGNTEGLKGIFESIKTALSGIKPPDLSDVWNTAKMTITTVVKEVDWSVPQETFNSLKSKIVEKLTSIDWSTIGGVGKGAADLFGKLTSKVGELLAGIDWSALGGVGKGAVDLFGKLKIKVGELLAGITWSDLGGVGKGAVDMFGGLKTVVMEKLAGIEWGTIAGDTLTKLQTGATTLKDTVLSTIADFKPGEISPEQTAKLQGVLDGVKPVVDALFGENGIIPTLTSTINESLIAVGTQLEGADGKALGEQFSGILTGIGGLASMLAVADLTATGERVKAVVLLGTDVLTFLSEFASGIDTEGLAGVVGTAATKMAEAIGGALPEEQLTTLGTAAGKFVGNVISKIGEFLGKPGFGQEVGDAAGESVGALAKGAMAIATGILSELAKVDWNTFFDQVKTFVQGFVSGTAAALAEADMGPVASAMTTALGKAITGMIGGMFPHGIFGEDPFGVDRLTKDLRKDSTSDILRPMEAAKFDWGKFIPKFEWSTAISALGWDSFVSNLGWSTFVGPLYWLSFVTKITWSSFVPKIDWGSFIPDIDWASFIPWLGDSASTDDTTSALKNQSAIGTRNWRGGLTWVGETGPEMVALPRGSRIWSNSDSMGMMAQQPITVNNYNTIYTPIDEEALAYRTAQIIQRRRGG